MSIEITLGQSLKSVKRRRELTQVILHESVTSTREKAVSVLSKRGLGVHFIVDLDGSVTQHVPISKASIHAAGHNQQSVAVEVINRYYSARAKAGSDIINAIWAHKGRYIFPPAIQLESVWRLVQWVTMEVDVVRGFPGLEADGFKWGRILNSNRPGIQAHHRSGHADGLVPEHYCVLRNEGFCPEKSYDLTRVAAGSMKRKTELPEAGEGEEA